MVCLIWIFSRPPSMTGFVHTLLGRWRGHQYVHAPRIYSKLTAPRDTIAQQCRLAASSAHMKSVGTTSKKTVASCSSTVRCSSTQNKQPYIGSSILLVRRWHLEMNFCRKRIPLLLYIPAGWRVLSFSTSFQPTSYEHLMQRADTVAL